MCRHLKRTLLAATLLAALAAIGASAPIPASTSAPPRVLQPISPEEHARTIEALRPPKRQRPLVAVLGHNDGTETTDFLVPYGVLRESGVADVFAVAPAAGPIRLLPALTVDPQETTTSFDRRFPDGADYVVVAAMHPRADPAVLEWIRAQAAKGATIVGVCSGGLTLSAAGLLHGRSATHYWYDRDVQRAANSTTRWVDDRRYVVDRGVVTTTGITASLPVSLALVEAIAGADRAARLAAHYGAGPWDARHDSGRFQLDLATKRVAVLNKLAFWGRETHGLLVEEGADEVAVGFAADAWSRTWRSDVLSVGATRAPLRTRHGLRLRPDRAKGAADVDRLVRLTDGQRPAETLAGSLQAIADRYGPDTAGFVALHLEFPWAVAD